MDLLRPQIAAQALDLPGCGASPPRLDGKYSITAMARTVIEVIEQQRNGPVHLIGNSMGGAVALRAAARRPDLVRSLTLISPALPDSRPRLDRIRFPVASIPKIGDYLVGRYLQFSAEQRVADTFNTCYYDPSTVEPERFAIEVEDLREQDRLPHSKHALIASMRTLTAEQALRPGPLSPWREAARVHVPTLVLYGTHDVLVRAKMASRARKAFRNATVTVLENTGHLAQMERPATVAARIRAMLAGNDGSTLAVGPVKRTVG
jgi:pimeloyl-ACP methyl ester carboxylesterase